MRIVRNLLWVDCTAAAAAGVGMLLCAGWLTELYAFPPGLLPFNGCVNLLYACYSFSLAVRRRRPMPLIVLLAAGNAMWAAVCFSAAVVLAGTVTPFGLVHLIGEGLFVGGLAAIEWQFRERLRSGDEVTPPASRPRS